MVNVRQVLLALAVLLAGRAFLLPLPRVAAADKGLTDVEIYKMESGTKDFVIDLVAAGVWKKGGDEFKLFNKYEPQKKLDIRKYDEEREEFLKETFEVNGAEYRRALVTAQAYASYRKLDDDGKKRLNMEIFGQEDRAEKGSDAAKAGAAKLKRIVNIILGERLLAPAPEKGAEKR